MVAKKQAKKKAAKKATKKATKKVAAPTPKRPKTPTKKTVLASKAKPIESVIPPLNLQQIELVLIGTSPLIVHAWSAKAKKAMLDKQQKKAVSNREARNPEAEFRESLYVLPDGNHGFPAIAFKAAAVTACSQIEHVTKVLMRQALHVIGDDFAIIYGDNPTMREDTVRIGMGTTTLRYRGEYKKWYTRLSIEYNADAISEEQIVNLFNTAGFGVGIGEWRPERDGSNGRFKVATPAEIAKLSFAPRK
jgi:hypothetical protein